MPLTPALLLTRAYEQLRLHSGLWAGQLRWLSGLRARLAPGGRILAVVTRRAYYPTRWLWHCQGYTARELAGIVRSAGLAEVTVRHYPLATGWLNIGSLVIEAGPGSA